jgi:hypothetical protein
MKALGRAGSAPQAPRRKSFCAAFSKKRPLSLLCEVGRAERRPQPGDGLKIKKKFFEKIQLSRNRDNFYVAHV